MCHHSRQDMASRSPWVCNVRSTVSPSLARKVYHGEFSGHLLPMHPTQQCTVGGTPKRDAKSPAGSHRRSRYGQCTVHTVRCCEVLDLEDHWVDMQAVRLHAGTLCSCRCSPHLKSPLCAAIWYLLVREHAHLPPLYYCVWRTGMAPCLSACLSLHFRKLRT